MDTTHSNEIEPTFRPEPSGIARKYEDFNKFWASLSNDERWGSLMAFELLERGLPVSERYIEMAKERRKLQGRDPETGEYVQLNQQELDASHTPDVTSLGQVALA